MAESEASNGRTRVEYLLGVPLDADVVRQWPQMQEAVHGSQLIGEVEGTFEELTLEVGRRLVQDDVIVVEWTPRPDEPAVDAGGRDLARRRAPEAPLSVGPTQAGRKPLRTPDGAGHR